jgi:dTDP-4-dehydrorhamnose reductase
MKILLFGKGGQVGWELQRALAPLGNVIALDFDNSGELSGDFSQPDAVAATVRKVAPDLIVNAAAHTAVDKAESEPALARMLNATTPGRIAAEAAALGAHLIHYSTDYVFDGSGNVPRDEAAQTNPLNVYGRTNVEAEQFVAASGATHLILRTSWVYAARGSNFAKTMLKLAKDRDRLTVICDQIGAPTGAELLADVTAHTARALRKNPRLGGLYHCVAAGETSWHGYAMHVIDTARAAGHDIKVGADAVLPVPTSEYPTPAARPLNSRLDTRKLRDTFGLVLPHWQQGVDRMLAEIL